MPCCRPGIADSDAAVHGFCEVAAVVVEGEAAHLRQGQRLRSAQVGVERTRGDEHARVEEVGGVEQLLESFERPDRIRRVHDRQQFAAGPPVAVLTREGAAVTGDETRSIRHQLAENGTVTLERDVEAHVDAAVAEVAVRHSGDAVAVEQLLEFAQVGTQTLRRNGRILEARPCLLARGGATGEADPVFADAPDGTRLAALREQARRQRVGVAHDRIGA